ncbi:MAG: DUF58 domain-containing protein [Propioniciclava sp.]
MVAPRPTPRFLGFLALGATILFTAWVSGQQDLLWVGVFCCALPLISVVPLFLRRPSLTATRSLDPEVVQRGDPVQVTLHLSAPDPAAPPAEIKDDPGPLLGPPRRFVLDPVDQQSAMATYALNPQRRGRFTFSKCSFLVQDPCGFWNRRYLLPTHTPLVVTPHVDPLPTLSLSIQGGLGETPLPHTALIGPDDATVRTYATGDDVRRIHWKATAHTGELMVRREEAAWDPTAWVLLDSRALPHDEDPESASFEWLVSAAASIGVRLLTDGYSVGLVDAEGVTHVVDQHQEAGAAQWLEPLIDVEPTQEEDLGKAVAPLSHEADDAIIVALLSHLDDTATDPLLRLGSPAQTRIALTLTAPTSSTGVPGQAQTTLEDHGWIVYPAHSGSKLHDIWSALGPRTGGR